MAKQRTSFALSEATKTKLKALAEKNLRSQASMLEFLVNEAAKKL